MNLVIDIGNSQTKVGVFDGDALVEASRCATMNLAELLSRPYNPPIREVLLSSVSTDCREIVGQLEPHFTVMVLTSKTPLPFQLDYETPDTLGNDRIAASAGALALFPRSNCLVIDAGTCITCDLLTKDGVYHGGSISPGIRMRLDVMHQLTARLPLVAPDYQLAENFIGKSTRQAMLQGAQWGATLEIAGMIAAFRRKHDNLKVLITGGDTGFFVKNLKTKIFARPNLVLIGLNKILQHNAQSDTA